MYSIVSLEMELRNLNSLCELIIRIIRNDDSEIEKYNEEVYDEDGDFIEIYNHKLDELYGHEKLLTKFIYYELNQIREYYLNSAMLDYYNNISNSGNGDYLQLIEKHKVYIDILSENNYDYDSEDAKNYRRLKEKNIDQSNIIELLLLYGDASRIPRSYLIKNSKDRINRNKHAYKSFIEHYSIKENQYWGEIEAIRKIANALKHCNGFKNIIQDSALSLGERYEPTIEDALEKIRTTSKFFREIYSTMKNDPAKVNSSA